MKRFFGKFLAFFLALLLPFAAFLTWVQAKPAMFCGSLMGSAWYKQQLLEQTDGARIIVLGGSSVPYSIVSEQVQAATGRPCINLGATAYLGVGFYFGQLKGNLHEGDIVIVAPEYVMYENTVSHSTVWMAAENHAEVLQHLPLSYWPKMISTYHLYAAQKLHLLRSEGAPTQTREQAYAASGFGPWGDILTQRTNILEHQYNTQDTHTVSAEMLSDTFVKELNRFSAYAQKQGASVYLSYAPFNRLALENGMEGVQALETQLKAVSSVPFLGKLTDGVMDENLFFDTNNHLNSQGAVLRTEALLQDLQAAGAL